MKNDDEKSVRRNDNEDNALIYDCYENKLSGVRRGEIRFKKTIFTELPLKITAVFLLHLSGYPSRKICPLFKISAKTVNRYIKKAYIKYPRLKHL